MAVPAGIAASLFERIKARSASMLRRAKNPPEGTLSEQSAPVAPKHEHPKILLIDLDDSAAVALQANGYNVQVGTFGTPYKVKKSDGVCPVIVDANLPNYTEQEIVVVDMVPSEPAEQPTREKDTSPGEDDWWISCSKGVVDPRPRAMTWAQESFDRILSHGGIFVIFADARNGPNMIWGHVHFDQFLKESDIPFDNWCFLSELSQDNLEVKADSGTEIVVSDSILGPVLSEYSTGSHFICTLHPFGSIEKSWITLATSKYGDAVAGAILAENEKGKPYGCVLIFPQLADKAGFLAELLGRVLPDLSPHLFPDVEGARWVQRSEYEIPKVLQLKASIDQIREEAARQIGVLEQKMGEARAAEGYLHALLTETGDNLVKAVKRSLEVIGFQAVIDMDEELARTGSKEQKREDLQIGDTSPLLLVEVKGVAGMPGDAESLQVWKYIAPRMRGLNRTDIQGLSILNHQRNLPGLDRADPFRKDILTNAQEHLFGLLTTWDLFRLVRSFGKLKWKHDQIKELFYQSGRIVPVPSHYEYIGVAARFWEHVGVIGVTIEAASLRLEDRIAFEFPIEFDEQVVESLQVDGQPVSEVTVGAQAGIKTSLTKQQWKRGVRVYRVREASSGI